MTFDEEITKAGPSEGKRAEASMLVNIPRLVTACYTEGHNLSVQAQRVAFSTLGHRDSVFVRTFNE